MHSDTLRLAYQAKEYPMRQPWEVIAQALQRAILDKTYKPGEQLPSENELAAQHGASRPTVRRALRELQLRGAH
jgi:DNA-binding GntR family transcriptional regulator